MKPEGISENLMFCTVRLVADNGSCGTGYFFNFNFEGIIVPVIITNKHVVNNNPSEVMTFSLHLTSDGASEDGNYSVRLTTNWIFHPSKDLCYTYVKGVFDQVYKNTGKHVFYKSIDSNLIYNEDQLLALSMIEPIVMVGYPNGLWDQLHNYPIFRHGYTAAHPGYDFNEKGIGMIDAACFPGSSGSPIFILNEGSYRDKKEGIVFGKNRIVFLGTLFAGPQYNVDGSIIIKNIPTSQVPIAQSKAMLNLGYYIKAHELKTFESIIKLDLDNKS